MTSDSVWTAQADFALDLLRKSQKDGENAFLSPASIAVALAMTYTGANAETKQQMNQVLAKGASDEVMHAAFGELVALLNKPNDGYKLHTANKVYVHQNTELKAPAVELLQKTYATELKKVDFVAETERVRNEINKWVEDQTADRIKELLPAGVLNVLTRMVLVNAIYFKGDWAHQFKKDETYKDKFYVSETKEVEVDMMHQKAKFEYFEDKNVQVLGMPYKSDDLAMYVLLPKEKFGLDKMLKELKGEKLLHLIRDTRKTEVQVSMPKFKLEQSFELSDALKAMGMPHAFDEQKADFTNFTEGEPLFISKVVHKAFLEVNEKGSEAAAATAVVMRGRGRSLKRAHEPHKVFTCDRPHFMLIASKVSNGRKQALLFSGVVRKF